MTTPPGLFAGVYYAAAHQLDKSSPGTRVLNSFGAGVVTGAALALHSRRAPVVAASAALSGALVVAVDLVGQGLAAGAEWAGQVFAHAKGGDGNREPETRR